MHPDQLRDLLDHVQSGKIQPGEAFQQLATLSFGDIGNAKIDHHRTLRCGFAEVIFCAGKEPRDVVRIIEEGLRGAPCMLATRADKQHLDAIKERFPSAIINARGGTARVGQALSMKTRGGIMVVTAGTSDIPVAEEALETLRAFGCEGYHSYDVGVAGLQRVLAVLPQLREAAAIICVAGMEGALPSVIGGLVACPVIAVPTSIGYGASFKGVAALLGMLNTCAAGVTVVNIDNGFGAAMSALRMIADKDYPMLEVPKQELPVALSIELAVENKTDEVKIAARDAQLERLEKAVEQLSLLAQKPLVVQMPESTAARTESVDHSAQLARLEKTVEQFALLAQKPVVVQMPELPAAQPMGPDHSAQLARLEKALEQLAFLPAAAQQNFPDHGEQILRLEKAVAELSAAVLARPIHIEIQHPSAPVVEHRPERSEASAFHNQREQPEQPGQRVESPHKAAHPKEKTVVKVAHKSKKPEVANKKSARK